ncbi:MAG: ATP-binding cassette domain-containing protein [Actinomycetia bacterium]|nr:ATP-binding cassette domain-containing protein [Actinomycetes bacterium]MCP4225383.1 ATP-binding cassette domain-containing protein [Actinomycetes bacterium]MCP5035843.1 ATP-binding cassette domain-containing protein [Actinomycetes bacterium]
MAPAIVTDGLTRTFTTGPRRNRRTIEAVKDLSFEVARGERLAFIGPNGAGKSTSIKMLTGILWPSAGTARVLGLEPWTERKALARSIGTLFGQRSQLWAELAPRATYRLLGAIFGLSDSHLATRINDLGEVLEASELFDQPVRTLSLGQRMRCELAACMLHQPEMLVLDEPTIGLDLLGKHLFRDLLIRLNTELGTTVFLTSHDVADIEHVADRAIVVNHGSLIYDASVTAMRRELLAVKQVDVHFRHDLDLSEVSATVGTGVTVALETPVELRLDVDTSRRPIGEVIDHVLRNAPGPVADLSVVDPPLEHVIGEIYRRPA